SASAFDFENNKSEFPGCGTPPPKLPYRGTNLEDASAGDLCNDFATVLGDLHADDMKKYFEDGVVRQQHWYQVEHGGKRAPFFNDMTWRSYQWGDGVVEVLSALSVCQNTYTPRGGSLTTLALPHCQ